MSKKHVKENVKELSRLYSRAQNLYEEAAELMSESMISGDVSISFVALKKDLDTELSNYSLLFSKVLESRQKFVEDLNKERFNFSRLCHLVDDLVEQKDKTPKEYSDAIMKQYFDSVDRLRIYTTVDEVSSFKNKDSKFLHLLTFKEIRVLLDSLKKFIDEEL